MLITRAKLASAVAHHFREKAFSRGSNANKNKGSREPPYPHAYLCPQNLAENSLAGEKEEVRP